MSLEWSWTPCCEVSGFPFAACQRAAPLPLPGTVGGGVSPPICSLQPSPPRSEFTDTILSVHPSDVLDMPVDPNEPTYCLCHQVSYGEMIGCDNPDVSVRARRGGCCHRTWGLEMGVLNTGVHCGPSGGVLCQVWGGGGCLFLGLAHRTAER